MKSREQKRNEAEARQQIYWDLPIKEKIQILKARRGESKKELVSLGMCEECGLGFDCVCATEPDEVSLEK